MSIVVSTETKAQTEKRALSIEGDLRLLEARANWIATMHELENSSEGIAEYFFDYRDINNEIICRVAMTVESIKDEGANFRRKNS